MSEKNGRRIFGGVLLAGAVVLAGCGGAASTPPAQAAGSTAQVFLNDITADHFSAVCSIVVPAEHKKCVAAMATLTPMLALDGGKPITGSLQVGNVVVHGAEALASTTGKVCSVSTSVSVSGSAGSGKAKRTCQSNHNAKAGLPATTGGFGAAYAAALRVGTSGSSTAAGAIPLEEIGGTWYVNAPASSGY